MKQFYYGNDYQNGGYGILAYSEGIPEKIKSLMIKCAEGITETSNGEFGLVFSGNSAILYLNSIVSPRFELGEHRKTYFSHQYYINSSQFGEFIEHMPKILVGLKFAREYKDVYDISDIQPELTREINVRLPKGLAEAAKKALKNDYRMVISGSNMNNQTMITLMAALTESLTLKERQRCGFMLCGKAKDVRMQNVRFIFCDKKLQYAIQAQLYNRCIYYDTDADEFFYSADIAPNEMVHEGKPSSKDNESNKLINYFDERDVNDKRDVDNMKDSPEEYYTDDNKVTKSKNNILGIIALIVSCASLVIAVYAYEMVENYKSEFEAAISEFEAAAEAETVSEIETVTEAETETLSETESTTEFSKAMPENEQNSFENSNPDTNENDSQTEDEIIEQEIDDNLQDLLTDSKKA